MCDVVTESLLLWKFFCEVTALCEQNICSVVGWDICGARLVQATTRPNSARQ